MNVREKDWVFDIDYGDRSDSPNMSGLGVDLQSSVMGVVMIDISAEVLCVLNRRCQLSRIRTEV